MARKSLVYIILLSMVMHCTSRLGILSYLYQERHSIAYSLGLINEIPIAVCSSDHDFGRGLKFTHSDQSHSLPVSMTVAHEINLFLSWPSLNLSPEFYQLPVNQFSSVSTQKYLSPHSAIFHPPASV
ncbi:MAG TPA: hypothetical protein VFW11_12540 [Cyclobacteriaceae bacterium]|nr:hypothetical protein [Cyclobacteriaceae bacterium]